MSPATFFALPPPAPPEPRHSILPLWVVYVATVGSGLVFLTGSVGASVARAPALAAAATLIFGLFGAACAWLLGRIPYFCPVGWDARLLAALWGATAAIGYALIANLSIHRTLAGRDAAPEWSLFAPFTEEPIKNAGVVVVLLLAARRPRTALDGLVVGSFVGLGFEVVENIVQSINNAIASSPPGHPSQWTSLATDVVFEVIRRSWTGHIVITGIAGFGIAYAMTAHRRSITQRWVVGSALLLLALAAHLLWNSHRFGIFYVLGQFGVLAIYLWLIRVGRAEEGGIYSPYLGYVGPELADPVLANSLGSAGARRRHRKTTSCSRERQRITARLATAIGDGDGATAQECATRLAVVTPAVAG